MYVEINWYEYDDDGPISVVAVGAGYGESIRSFLTQENGSYSGEAHFMRPAAGAFTPGYEGASTLVTVPAEVIEQSRELCRDNGVHVCYYGSGKLSLK